MPPRTPMAPARTQLPAAAQDNDPRAGLGPGPAPVMVWAVRQVPFFSVDTNGCTSPRPTPDKPAALHAPAAGESSWSIPASSLSVPGKDSAVPQVPCVSVTANASSRPASV